DHREQPGQPGDRVGVKRGNAGQRPRKVAVGAGPDRRVRRGQPADHGGGDPQVRRVRHAEGHRLGGGGGGGAGGGGGGRGGGAAVPVGHRRSHRSGRGPGCAGRPAGRSARKLAHRRPAARRGAGPGGLTLRQQGGTTVYRLTGVTKLYQKGQRTVPAVRDLDLLIENGEWLAVQGRTGHGKSTLLNLLGGLDRATEGTVELDGTDLGALRET